MRRVDKSAKASLTSILKEASQHARVKWRKLLRRYDLPLCSESNDVDDYAQKRSRRSLLGKCEFSNRARWKAGLIPFSGVVPTAM